MIANGTVDVIQEAPSRVVEVGDCIVAAGSNLATFALGSCIAVTIVDTEVFVAGLLHFKLPDSASDPARAIANPFLFGDTGIRMLLRLAFKLGVQKRRMRVCLAGGAQTIGDTGLQIGKQNYLAARKTLWKEGIMVFKEAIGGDASRSISVTPSGLVVVRASGASEPLHLTTPPGGRL